MRAGRSVPKPSGLRAEVAGGEDVRVLGYPQCLTYVRFEPGLSEDFADILRAALSC